MKKSIYKILILLISFSCSQTDDGQKIRTYQGNRITIKYTADLNHGDWIKIDEFLFVHRKDFDPQMPPGLMLDSVTTSGALIHYYPLSTSVREFTVEDGKIFKEMVNGTAILGDMTEHLSQINSYKKKYKMNLGANLWLNNTLEFFGNDSSLISVKTSDRYNALITGN